MRSKRLAGAALAAALAAGCRRPPAAPAAEAGNAATLAAPAPSSTVVTSPLGAGESSFTNEMQAQNLRDQAAKLGISRLSKPSTPGTDSDERHRTITYQEGIERTREMRREVEAERHAIDADKNKSVALPTGTPGLISGDKAGSPIEANEVSRPKDPTTP